MAAKLALRLRDLDTGELLVGEFDHLDAAKQWLRERPENIEVLGVATSDLAEGDDLALRAAMRPLSPEEKLKARAHDEARMAAIQEQIQREQARFQAAVEAERAAMKDADPNRPMVVSWDEHDGLSLADPSDSRTIADVVRTAVAAWVAERNEWVHGRRQHVARATITVWPGPIPGGDESERCHGGGQFETEPGLVD